jgi:HAE1 family hydrophobic/amphiphilic exporter-1
MNITELFIRRPVMTTLVMATILLFGVMGYRALPVSDLPNVDFPTIRVNAQLPGASPETMAASIATPLERQFSTIPGLDNMTSTSSRGTTNIILQFVLERSIDAAAQDVQTNIAAIQRRLPPGMPSPPSYQKVNPADQPIISFSMNSDTIPLPTVDEYAETLIGPRISMINGVASVDIMGAAKFAVRAQVDPTILAARHIGIDEVSTAIDRSNANMPTGTLWGRDQAFTVQADGQLFNADAYKNLIVTFKNGSPVRLGELGNVINSVQNDKQASTFNNERSINLQVMRQPGTNTVEIVDKVKAMLPELRQQIPPSVRLDVSYDRSQSIRDSVNDVKFTLLLTMGLVILVIFLFLRNASATIIPSLALPMSVIGTFAAMYLLGFSLDNLSLMALTLSVGFVVDDAIVVLENIVRHMEMGKQRMAAALEGAREIGFTIISMTLSLTAVFIPVLFMGGIIGRLFHEFAIVISVSILISGFVSLSLTPMACSRFLKPPTEHHGRFYRVTEKGFDGMRDAYRWTLDKVIRHRLITVVVAIGTLIGTYQLFKIAPTGFLPSEDTGMISGSVEFSQDSSFDAQLRLLQQVSTVVQDNPNTDGTQAFVGGGFGGSGARVMVKLKDEVERKDNADDVINQLRPGLNRIAGVRAVFQNPPPIRIGGMMTRAAYQFTLQAQDLPELYRSAQTFERVMRTIPGLTDVNSDLQIASPQIDVKIDRDKAAALAVDANAIEDALYNGYGARQVSNIFAPTNDYQVILELLPKYQADPRSLDLLYIRSRTGTLVPLNTLVRMSQSVAALQITHLGQSPSVTLSFNTAPGVSLGDAVERVNDAARDTLPATVRTTFQGTAAAFQSSFDGMTVLLFMALLVIYVVLGILYESFIHPLTILSGLPSAGVGALAALILFKNELNIYSFVGIIMLIGIVKKNAIMMIDFALEAQRTHNVPAADAIYEACLVRFRPIMMTTMAALMGTLPIALGMGAGAESRRPLGIAVVGGLVVSQMLTLYITPVIYIYMERFQSMFSRVRPRRKTIPMAKPAEAFKG